jgi:hemerythrin-like domain-containing protein
MPVNIGDKPDADFSQPIELMKSCHRRIERFLQTLKKIGQRRELDAQHAAALRTAIDYFKSAGPRHNEDEEVSLFPALAASTDAAVAAAMLRMRQLAEEHAAAEKLHHQIDELAEAWLKSGKISDSDRRAFQVAVDSLISMYTPHIAMEENDIFPLAAKVLDSSTLQNIGTQMRSRRAENPGREGSRCAQRRQQYPS